MSSTAELRARLTHVCAAITGNSASASRQLAARAAALCARLDRLEQLPGAASPAVEQSSSRIDVSGTAVSKSQTPVPAAAKPKATCTAIPAAADARTGGTVQKKSAKQKKKRPAPLTSSAAARPPVRLLVLHGWGQSAAEMAKVAGAEDPTKLKKSCVPAAFAPRDD